MDRLIEESRQLTHTRKPNLIILRVQELVRETAAQTEREPDAPSGPDAT
jgi:hypothetical protein